jgi:hypothetical protein
MLMEHSSDWTRFAGILGVIAPPFNLFYVLLFIAEIPPLLLSMILDIKNRVLEQMFARKKSP